MGLVSSTANSVEMTNKSILVHVDSTDDMLANAAIVGSVGGYAQPGPTSLRSWGAVGELV